MLRPVDPAERPQLESFLRQHIETSMFPLDNLHHYGMDDPNLPRAMTFWRTGDFHAVLGLSNDGILFPQAPTADDAFWQAARQLLKGRSLSGTLGGAGQCRTLIDALQLADAPSLLNADEPHFTLDLAALQMPPIDDLRLTPLDAAPKDLLIAWRAAYQEEVAGRDRATAEEQAPDEIDRYMKRGNHRVLWHHDTPVCFSGFNAVVEDTVQIGGVYTPPEHRRRGFARAAVALHLQEAQQNGTERALLFAANEAAARAYRAIGFRQIGQFSLVVWDGPQQVATYG